MICYETDLAAMLNAKLLADWATIATPIIAFWALRYAKGQIKTARLESRRATAYAAYDGYIKLCLENSSLACGVKDEVTKNKDIYSRYKWFVANMLFVFEQTLEACKDDPTWKATIQHQLKRHKWHLDSSKSAKRNEWSKELKELFP
ncbi:hypothetical protein L2747_19390 [Shewanella marinintestina]|uniref:hypothetical protein n=1 Tax=Shewanella marinintestina TaxID=190305 RepID=UPI00200F5010|nr:hypothetical protein [Shewanella marinintestina]MCL1148173.1 hypothetical protein [Shewanella marinintestina]